MKNTNSPEDINNNTAVLGEPNGTNKQHMKQNDNNSERKSESIVYRVGSLDYTIWKVKNRDKHYFQVPWYPNGPGGKRKVKTFSSLVKAKTFINLLATGKENTTAMLVQISPKEIAATSVIVSKLLPLIEPRGLGLVDVVAEYKHAKDLIGWGSLTTVLTEYTEAKALVGTASLVETVRDYVRTEWFTKQNTPYLTAMEAFLDQREREKCRPRTIRTLRYSIQPLGKALGNPPVITVTRDQLFKAIHRDDCKPRSNRSTYAGLHNFFTWLKENGYLRPDVPSAMDPIKAPKYDRSPPVIIDPKTAAASLKALALYATPEDVLYFAMAMFTGIRSYELQQVTSKHVDWTHKQVNLTEDITKLREPRTVPIPDSLVPWMEPFVWRKGPLFEHEKPQTQVARVLRHFGIPWGRNWLRHSYCTYRLCLTNEVIETARYAGHSPSTLLGIYTNIDAHKPHAAEYFGLTPTACGVTDWPTRVAQWFRTDCPAAVIPTLKKKQKPTGPVFPFPDFGDGKSAA